MYIGCLPTGEAVCGVFNTLVGVTEALFYKVMNFHSLWFQLDAVCRTLECPMVCFLLVLRSLVENYRGKLVFGYSLDVSLLILITCQI